ncbi:MAG: rod shape-determining protein MreD [Clostridia bacterium]|nr:rod shape-determining protein MreD [Clostridia bacterium]
MKTKKHTSTFYVWVSVIGFLLFTFDSTGLAPLNIGNARPLLLLPLLVAVAMAGREWIGLLFGAVFGILLDTIGAETLCFNMIALFIIGTVCGLLCAHYVNDNVYSAVALCFFSNLFYYVARWFFFYVCAGREEVFSYFFRYCVPTILYNTVFIIPFYFLLRYLSRRTSYYD